MAKLQRQESERRAFLTAEERAKNQAASQSSPVATTPATAPQALPPTTTPGALLPAGNLRPNTGSSALANTVVLIPANPPTQNTIVALSSNSSAPSSTQSSGPLASASTNTTPPSTGSQRLKPSRNMSI